MEALSLRPQRYRADDAPFRRTQGPTQRSTKLPTPEPSTDSNDTTDQDEREYRRSSQYYGRTASDATTTYQSFRRDSRNGYSPNSPPYAAMDAQKPSLPPLKSILGDSLTSPPQTPQMKSASMQPAPREPTFSADTYKPPSLYPNKKLRTDFTFEPVAPITTVSGFTTPITTTAPFSQMPTGMPMDTTRPRQDGYGSDMYQRRERQRESISRPNPQPTEPYRSPRDRLPSGLPQSSNPYHPQQPREPFYHDVNERRFDDRFSYQPNTSFTGSQHRGFNDGTSMRHFGREQPYSGPELSMMPHEAPQQYFVPNHYEYQHAKSRKRSNLPKQSTEVMRTWFDQNISNPYPSEEQKAIFSNITGISMTQVSNWFINHRRRCPELKDKRDKTRGRE